MKDGVQKVGIGTLLGMFYTKILYHVHNPTSYFWFNINLNHINADATSSHRRRSDVMCLLGCECLLTESKI